MERVLSLSYKFRLKVCSNRKGMVINMIKIMIVDDMPIFLEYLRGCIDWNAYGFEICCEAHDGKEAWEKIGQYYPDVVLTDITMPHINGIQLSEKIVEHYPDISIILITGNNEFEYARKAVKIGVCDYIVKPFEKEELILSLLKLQDNVNRALELKTVTEENELDQKEQLLRKLVHSNYLSNPKEEIQEVGIQFNTDYFLIGLIKFPVNKSKDMEQIINWEHILIDILDGMLDIKGHYEICRDFENNIVLILNFESEEEMKDYKIYELQDLIQIIKSQLHLECVIGISNYCYDMQHINQEYSYLLQMLSALSVPRNKIIDYRKEKGTFKQEMYSLSVIEEFNYSLEALHESAIITVIEDEWVRIRELHEETKINFLSSLVSILMTHIINAGRNIEDIYGKDFSPYEEIFLMNDWDSKKNRVIELCQKRIAYEKNGSSKKSMEVAQKAKEYIEANFSSPEMSITDISKALLLNQTYLRKMFKNEMNMTLTEYITKYRMTMAKKMILETDYKLTQISDEVGYSDISYFSKCFKKFYGVSPKNMSSFSSL